jgi:hypothetical protein
METIFVFVVILVVFIPKIIYGISLLFDFTGGNKLTDFLYKQEEKKDFQIDLLIEAQEMIENKKYKYICNTIKYIKLNNRLSDEEILWCNEILNIIQDSLWPNQCLEDWLSTQCSDWQEVDMVEYRSQFIDQLIDYIADSDKYNE